MLDLNKCELIETRVQKLSKNVALVEEGAALVYFIEDGVGVVKPSTGAAKEVFAGIAISRPTLPGVLPFFEAKAIPASSPYTVALTHAQNGSDISVVAVAANGTRTVLTAGTPGSAAGEYSISGGVITLNSAQASKTLEIGYNRVIGLTEARLRFVTDEFAPVTTALDTTGLCATGEVFITNYVISDNWAGWANVTDNPIKLGADGKLTLSGSGVTIPAVVSAVPGVNGVFLGIRLNMGN